MVLPFAALAPKIIIPSFFIAHKVRGEKDVAKILTTIAFTLSFAATVIILFHDKMPWIALITCMSAVLFYQRSEDIVPQTTLIYALSLAIMGLTCYGEGCSLLATAGMLTYFGSYFIKNSAAFTIAHMLGLFGFAYGVHDPSFLKQMASIGEHLA